MARHLLTADAASRSGVTLSHTTIAANGGEVAFSAEPRLVFELTNTSGNPGIVTFEIVTLVDGIAVVNGGRQVAVADGVTKIAAPYTLDYRQVDAMLYIDCSVPISIGVLSVGPAV